MNQSASFIPGRELARQLAGTLEPALRKHFPEMQLAIAHLGPGSEVLGFDTNRSMDHDWGPGVTVLVPNGQVETVRRQFDEHLDLLLPPTVEGFPTRFSQHPDGTAKPDGNGTGHRVRITSLEEIIRSTLLIDSLGEMNDAVWLSTPMQVLLELTAGEVFVDDKGELTNLRRQLAFYPDHIWRYQLAGLWMRVFQMQPFIGRCFETGDRTGATTIAFGIVRDLMRIGLVQSRQYAPYAKWLGTAFARTSIGEQVAPYLNVAVNNVTDFALLEEAINAAGGELIRQLNRFKLIAQVDPLPKQFWDRPFMVFPAEEIALALKASVDGSGLERFGTILGGIDAMTDSTDALVSHQYRLAIRAMFESW